MSDTPEPLAVGAMVNLLDVALSSTLQTKTLRQMGLSMREIYDLHRWAHQNFAPVRSEITRLTRRVIALEQRLREDEAGECGQRGEVPKEEA